MKTEESNKLIAEFMGETYLDVDCIAHLSICDDDGFCSICGHQEQLLPNYHKSWNNLIPVVEKIESLDIVDGVVIRWDKLNERQSCIIGIDEDDEDTLDIRVYDYNARTATYKAVVEFIQWYNKQNT